jgi:hypothetical protein
MKMGAVLDSFQAEQNDTLFIISYFSNYIYENEIMYTMQTANKNTRRRNRRRHEEDDEEDREEALKRLDF